MWFPSTRPLRSLLSDGGARLQPVAHVHPPRGGDGPLEAYDPQSFGAGGCPGDEIAGDGWLRPCVLEGIVVYPQAGDANGLLVHLHPDMGVPIGTVPHSWLTIQGHFDDPAAQTCRKVTEGATVEDPAFIEACRQEFVATEIDSSD